VLALSACVVSIWLPGSRTHLSTPPHLFMPTEDTENITTTTAAPSPPQSHTTGSDLHHYTSIVVYLVGITLSRYGRITAEVTINQLMQESVDATNRGAVFGVQTSLRHLCTLVGDASLIVLPGVHSYAWLILGSFAMAMVSFCNYVYYYFFHCHVGRRLG
jgi:ABC-type Fe3+-siderophore transport system permease subunit